MLTSRILAAIALGFVAVRPSSARGDAQTDAAVREAWAQGSAACLRADYELAIREFTKGIKLNPNDPATYNNRGYAYLQNGDVDKSIADYSEALRLNPKFAKARFYRGCSYEKKGDQDKAVADYAAAIRLDRLYARKYCDGQITTLKPPLANHIGGLPSERVKNARAAVNYFVAPSGNDRNPGTIERPFATLYKAYQFVKPGDTVNLRAGTYEALINWSKSGTPAAPITIRAYNGEDVRLQSSEQYAWTRVRDDVFGDCWKTSIPDRPIRYPGVQHAIWQDAVTAASEPAIRILAIVKGGYMCAPLNAAADFAHPQAAPGLPLTDRGGRLLYDITWYDRKSKTLWFKPGPSRVKDPSRQLYVTSVACGQFSTTASYLKISGLKFEYLFDFHQQDNPTCCDISDCEIKHACLGIVGGGERCTYTSLFIDKVGDWLTWRNGAYDRGYLDHCFYFNGSRCVIANCFFGRSNKGGPIHNYPDGVAENLFDSNVLYNSDGGSIFMGSGKNYITNNISLQKTYGISPYVNVQGFHFINNYSEAANPFYFFYQEEEGAYKGTFERFAIIGNVFNNRGGTVSYRGNVVTAKQSRVDENVYLGTPHWIVGLTQANPPLSRSDSLANYASYVAALQALPDCAAWEKKSQARAAAPQFDFASFDALLDSDPPLADVLQKTRQYVKGITAPFPSAGPAIDGPLSGISRQGSSTGNDSRLDARENTPLTRAVELLRR